MQSFAKNRILRIRRLQRWRGIAAMQQGFDSPLNIPGLPNRRETACVVPRPSIPGATGLFFGLLPGSCYSPVWVRQDSRIFRRHLRQDHFQPSRHLILHLKAWHPGFSLDSPVSSRAFFWLQRPNQVSSGKAMTIQSQQDIDLVALDCTSSRCKPSGCPMGCFCYSNQLGNCHH